MQRVVNKSSCGGNFTPGWFSFNNSETVKAVTLTFCSIQYHFITDIRAKFGIPNFSQSSDIGQNSDGGISDFWIACQCLIKENCHNSRTSDDNNMKLGPVTKLDKRNKTMLKYFNDDVISANCNVIVIFPISGQFGVIREQDSGRRVCKIYIFINNNLLFYKNWKQNSRQLSHYCFE